MYQKLKKFIFDENGAETMEYVAILCAGAALVAVVYTVSGKNNTAAGNAEGTIDNELAVMQGG